MDINENDEGAAGGGKAGGWSEGEKYNFLLKVIDQLSDGKPVKLADIEMPGRTTKALSHQWQKIRADAAAAGNGSGDSGNKVAKKPATPRKKKTPELDADGNVVKTPRKRKAKAPAAEAKDEDMA